jgi:hypothetical protein
MGKVTTHDINRLRDKLCCLIENTDELESILSGVATEATLQMVLSAIQDGQDFEAKLVVDDNGNGATYLEVRIWNSDTQTWEAPLYYAPGSNTGLPLASLTAPIIYINPNTLLAQIASNTTGLNLEVTQQLVLTELQSIDTNVSDVATETTLSALSTWITGNAATEVTLSALNAKFNTLGQKLSAASAPVVLSTEQEAILASIDAAVSALDTSTLATEVTLQATNTLLTTIDTVLDNIKLDTANLDVALSTLASEATLTAIDTVLDNIKLDTANLDVALSTRASEATASSIDSKLTTISKTPNVTVATVNGATAAGKRFVSFWFRGAGGTLAGASVPNGARFTFPASWNDTLGAISYTVPTGGAQEIIITDF